jgi:4-hydroxybutyrate dehydrogenase/sulfolactaldehyde 3-reductase
MALSRIGFIGLGTMGRPMAMNVRKKGYPMVVHDAIEASMADLVAAGAQAAASPAEVAAASDVVITMLPDAPDVEAVATGPNGILGSQRSGAIYLDMSTIDPATTRRVGGKMAAKGIRMLDSPVGRLQQNAVAGTLVLMVGGDAAVVEEVRPVLMCMAETLFHCGALGSGQAIKLINNCLATSVLEATAEALVTGTRAGLPLELMRTVFASTMAGNNQLAVMLPKKALHGDFSPGFMIRLARKDVRLAVELARALGVPAPVGEATLATLVAADEAGQGGDDVTGLLKRVELAAGVEVRLAPATG